MGGRDISKQSNHEMSKSTSRSGLMEDSVFLTSPKDSSKVKNRTSSMNFSFKSPTSSNIKNQELKD